MPEPGSTLAELTGWGRTAPTAAHLTEIGPELVAAAVTGAGSRGVIARGLGRSYGDAAQNAGGDVLGALPSWIDTEGLSDPEPWVRVSAGTSLHELMRTLLPTGHFVPVTPGTRQVTVGGAVAADVHGKNHHRDGSMGRHVVSLDLVLADGTSRTVSAENDRDLFWATVGGMGLTGVITGVALKVTPVETGYVSVHTERIDRLDQLMARMREADDEWTHSVAWIDTLARGRRLGRAVLTVGEHARVSDLTPARQKDRWALPGGALLGVPPYVPPRAMSRPAIRAFNELWFRKAPRLREGELQTVSTFFHPLDGVRDWNRLYGPAGMVQYQFVIPDSSESELPGLLTHVAEAGHPSFLSVLKRFGPGNEGLLSFPMQGWTLAMDLPTAPGLRQLFAELDEAVAACGGRIYLAKDSRMSAELLEQTYPRLAEFRAVRDKVDPTGVFQSDLSRRLGL